VRSPAASPPCRATPRQLAEKLVAANAGLGAIAGSLSSARDHLVATDAGLAVLTGGDQQQVA